MKQYGWNDLSGRLKSVLTKKRTKAALYIAAVLWVAVAAQVIMNKAFTQEIQITEAFVKSDTEEMSSSLELVSEYKTGFLSAAAKEKIIRNLADAIGLTIDDDINVLEEDERSEAYYYKKAKKASTEIEVVSKEQKEKDEVKVKQYLIVKLDISDGIQSVEKYKKQLETVLDKLDVSSRQFTLKYEGNKDGNLSASQKKEIAEMLVSKLQGKIALEYDEGDIYTVYGYTGLLNEYVTSAGNKINIQIAITYNELTNKTTITLATPVLNENW